MRYIDTHTHLFDEQFDNDIDEVISEMKEKGVYKAVLPSIDSGSHERIISLTNSYPDIFIPAIGLHPTSVNEIKDYKRELNIIEEYLRNNPGYFKAIGEIGIDLYWSKDFVEQQIDAFTYQIDIAINNNLPIIVHTRDAFDIVIDIISHYKGKLRGIFHAFSGSYDQYKEIKSLGEFKFGIGGVVTFKKSNIAETVRLMDIEDILLETDSPYLAPSPYRGKRNKSSYIEYVAMKIAEIKNMKLERVAEQTCLNFQSLFN